MDRTAYCWGYNESGQTGTGVADELVLKPKKVASTISWAKVSPGYENACGISTAGALYCWGSNSYGGVGDGSGIDQPLPVRVGAGTTWAGIQVGYYHACARTTSSKVSCWGYGGDGELGNGSTDDVGVPTAVPGSFAQINTSAETTCGVTVAGISECWGYNGSGNVGDGTTTNQSSPTILASGSKSFSSVLAGYDFSCGITSSQGKVRCFGGNFSHEFGNGSTAGSLTPTDAAGGLTDWAQVSLGDYTSCGLRASGALYCWGYNVSGQLGVGTTDDYDHRVLVGRTPAAKPSPTGSSSANRMAAHGPTGRP